MANHNETVSLPIHDFVYEWQQPARANNPREVQSIVDYRWPGVPWPQTGDSFPYEPNYAGWNPDYSNITLYGPSNNWWNKQQVDLNKFSPLHELGQFHKFANGILCKMADITKKNPSCAATWDGEWKAI